MKQDTVGSGTIWEARYGYCRAVRAGAFVAVGGTAALNEDGSPHAPGDARAQTLRCYEIIARAIARFGLQRSAIVRSRLYVTDISLADEFGRAHRDFFAGHIPCMTMVQVGALIHPDMLVEVEADAVAPTHDGAFLL